jgi:hypothetical protein
MKSYPVSPSSIFEEHDSRATTLTSFEEMLLSTYINRVVTIDLYN